MARISTKVEHQSLPLLDHLGRVARRAADASMPPGGLRPRHLIALKLLSERGPVTQQALSELLSLDPNNVVGLLNELEERGLITRRRAPADRRRHIVELSGAGHAELAAAYARLSVIEDHLLGALSADERAILYRLLVRAVGAESPPCDAGDEGRRGSPTGRGAGRGYRLEADAGRKSGGPPGTGGRPPACSSALPRPLMTPASGHGPGRSAASTWTRRPAPC